MCVAPWLCSQPCSSSSDTSFIQMRFLLIVPELPSRKMLREKFVLWWFILSSSGHRSNQKWQWSVEKKVIIKKYMLACIFPNHQASLPIPEKRRNHVMLSLMSECRIMPTPVFQRRLLWFSCQIQTIISCSFLPPQIFTSRNVK